MKRLTCLLMIAVAGAVQAQPVVASYAQTTRAPTRWTVEARALVEIGGQDGTGPAELRCV